nr:mycofactocin-coupled SDR family oxidoreductase [Rhodococcus sp. (in: high G+C Gram-positive bacteria)]
MVENGRMTGKVVLITGVARGQGRAHAVRLAQEGADIIGLDICAGIDTIPVPLATEEDLAETVAQVEALDRRIVARVADTRDQAAVDFVVAEGLSEFGRLDVVIVNAGSGSTGKVWELTDAEWQTMIDVNLTGAFHTVKAAIPHMIEQGDGGSIVLTSSLGGLSPMAGIAHYVAAKHGVLGLMKNLAVELGPHGIRANAICPGNTRTPLAEWALEDLVGPIFKESSGDRWQEELDKAMAATNPMNTPWVEAVDQANAALFLASDEARFITGQSLVVDAGWGTWMK